MGQTVAGLDHDVRRRTRPNVRIEALEGRQLFNGLSATYFDNPDFTGGTATAIDTTVNYKWPKSPALGIDHNTFSARWTGSVRAAYSETYKIYRRRR